MLRCFQIALARRFERQAVLIRRKILTQYSSELVAVPTCLATIDLGDSLATPVVLQAQIAYGRLFDIPARVLPGHTSEAEYGETPENSRPHLDTHVHWTRSSWISPCVQIVQCEQRFTIARVNDLRLGSRDSVPLYPLTHPRGLNPRGTIKTTRET